MEGKVNSRWLTLKLLDSDPSLMKELREYLDEDILEVPEISLALSQAREHLAKYGITNEILKDRIVAALVASAEKICVIRSSSTKTDTMKVTGSWIRF
mgnify:CR=1 FL=1